MKTNIRAQIKPDNLRAKGLLSLFYNAAKNVPAYKDFLRKNNIDPQKIGTIDDFSHVPVMTKDNYLKQYPLKDLLWDGRMNDAHIISMSSGSSGEPFFWSRGNRSIEESIDLLEIPFKYSFSADRKSTLCIIAFAMGTWIAGTYILSGHMGLADRGYKAVSITPGINTQEIIRILQRIGNQFDQVLISGYPPFVKDILDEAQGAGVDLSRINIRCMFAGENFSEVFRDHILEKIHQPDNIFATASIYGTADAGIMGIETPFSIMCRRLMTKDGRLFSKFFPDVQIMPSIVQYNPLYRYCETVDHYLVFTVNNSLPLIRYNILDQGRVIEHDQLVSEVTDAGYKIPESLSTIPKNPYVAIYGRADVATMFYSLNIYPENIKYGLEVPTLQLYITGKFVITSEFDKNQTQTLHLYVELRDGISETRVLRETLLQSVIDSLQRTNSEYNKLRHEIKQKADPIITFLPYKSERFVIKTKHRWVSKP